jgi:hypothetical protein
MIWLSSLIRLQLLHTGLTALMPAGSQLDEYFYALQID